MIPTGSICGRSWRIRWAAGARRLATCVVGVLVLLVAARARAGWRTDLTAPGRPLDDVEMWAPDTFAVNSTLGAVLFLPGKAPRPLGTGSGLSVGTYYVAASDCFISLNQDGNSTSRTSIDGAEHVCTGTDMPFFVAENLAMRVRHAAGGGAMVLTSGTPGYEVYATDGGISESTPMSRVALLPDGPYTGVLSVMRMGSTLYALVGLGYSDARVYWLDTLGNRVSSDMGDTSRGVVLSSDLFAAGGLPYAVLGTTTGMLLRGPLEGLTSKISPVQQFDGGVQVTGVSMNVEAGGTNGTGFGMAVLKQADGSRAVASPVPMTDPTKAGTLWRLRSIPPAIAAAPLKQVACAGASSCAFTVDTTGPGNVILYTNTAGPAIVASGPVAVDEGQSQQLTVSANDPDGDPSLLTFAAPGGKPWTLEQLDAGTDGGWLPGDPLVLKVTAGRVCQGGTAGNITINASDGLRTNDTRKDIPVVVNHTVKPDVPGVSASAPGGLVAGTDEPLTLSPLSVVTADGCRLNEFHWSLDAGTPDAPSLAQVDHDAVLMAPTTLCSASGKDFPVQLQVTDEGGLSNSNPAAFTVHVAPWGRPNAAFLAGTPAVQVTAGKAPVDIGPDAPVHACASTPLFPGVETSWLAADMSVADGGVAPDGGLAGAITLRSVDTGTEVRSFPATASALRVESRDCVDADLVLTASNRMRDSGALTGPPSERRVEVRTSLVPVESGSLQLDTRVDPSHPDQLRVDTGTDLNCPERRDLRAELQFQRTEGGATWTESVPVLGGGTVTLPVGCQGGSFQLKATLVDGTGRRAPGTVARVVETPSLNAGLAPLTETPAMVARCGEGAHATLTQTFPEGTCQSPEVSWSQVSGPLLAQSAWSGSTVSLDTRATGLNELVGQSVVLQVTATANAHSQASAEYTLPITVDPFVKVHRRAEQPAASDTGLVGVSVELVNTTACGVDGVHYEEHLTGLTYVADSAQLDGHPVAATWEGDTLTVEGLSLPGNGSQVLTYVARPHLVGERNMTGKAILNKAIISLPVDAGPQVPVSGCGCGSSGSGPVLVALGALGVAVRRRRTTGRS